MVEIDVNIRDKFIKNRLKKLQEAILTMEVDINSMSNRLIELKQLKERAEKEVSDLRIDLGRVNAQKEEAAEDGKR